MLVQVTREHIDKGTRNDSVRCPISISIREMGYNWVSTCQADCLVKKTNLQDDDPCWLYQLPPIAEQFVRLFDDGKAVKPIQFVLDDPTLQVSEHE